MCIIYILLTKLYQIYYNELNLENKNLDEYTSKELEIIVTKFNEKQNKYLGVCVRQDIHNLFHSIYGDIANYK